MLLLKTINRLIDRRRQIDKDCAIVVVSCMNDFETLRKLIP